MSYEVIIDISDVERRSFDFKRMFDESIPCKERIVRCRDCRFKAKDGDWCCRTDHEFAIEPNSFCSWAERKVDE